MSGSRPSHSQGQLAKPLSAPWTWITFRIRSRARILRLLHKIGSPRPVSSTCSRSGDTRPRKRSSCEPGCCCPVGDLQQAIWQRKRWLARLRLLDRGFSFAPATAVKLCIKALVRISDASCLNMMRLLDPSGEHKAQRCVLDLSNRMLPSTNPGELLELDLGGRSTVQRPRASIR